MPDLTPTNAAVARKPTARQLAYLKDLAAQRGQSFTYPTITAEASREIKRMRGIRHTPPADVTRERRQIADRFQRARNDHAAHQRLRAVTVFDEMIAWMPRHAPTLKAAL
jgi:hypothetical protein